MAAGFWGDQWVYGTISTTTWDTSTNTNLLHCGSAQSEPDTRKQTALEWLDDRIDEVREMGRELMS